MAQRIVIFSTKGGVGKTFIASNLAVSLHRDYERRVLLIDLDVQAVGDMARILDLNPQRAIADTMYFFKKHLNETPDKDEFITKSSSGVDFLPAVLRAQQSPHIEPDKIKDVLKLYDGSYDYTIIDAGKSLSELFVAVLNLSLIHISEPTRPY